MNLISKFFATCKNQGVSIALKKAFNKVFKRQNAKSTPTAKSTPIMPYLNGPESSKSQRLSPYYMAASLSTYDVISFDIFDTLVLRNLNEPADLFMLIGEKLNIFNFSNIRIRSEKEARDQKFASFNNREVTINEIYEKVAYYTGIDANVGIETELEVEFDMCYANPYFQRIVAILKSMGKRIYATSNMYIPSTMMKSLLKKCGYDGFEDIIVSCDYNCSKTNGELFKILKQKCKSSQIVHVGDNYIADVQGAGIAGIKGLHYKSCRDYGNEHRSPGMSALIGSGYRAIVNNYLHNGINSLTLLEEYGFIYGGVIALGFSNWIHRQAIVDQVDKILFLSRDGFIVNSVYSKAYNDIPAQYFYWSRIAAMRNVVAGEREPFLSRLFSERANKGDTLGDILALLGINPRNTELFNKKGINADTILIAENVRIIIDYFVKNWDEICALLSDSHLNTLQYIKNSVGNSKKVAIVDVGWSGKNLYPLRKALKSIGVDSCNYMLGTITGNQAATDTLSGTTKCYMFNSEYNRDIYDRFRKESTGALEAVEKLFSAAHPSFLGFNSKGDADFCAPEELNYAAYSEIKSGILLFCDLYNQAFSNYSTMDKIAGYDAFIPERLVFNNKDYRALVLGNMSFNVGINPTDRKFLADIYGGNKK